MHIKFFQGQKYYLNQFLLIWILSIFGNLFLLFLSSRIHELPLFLSLPSFVVFSLLFGVVAKCGINFVIKTDLNSLKPHNFIKTDLIPSLVGTAMSIVIIFLLNRILIKIPLEDITFLDSSPLWTKIISSFYNGLNLEIFFRLFILTFIYFILSKIFKKKEFQKKLVWSAILLASITQMSLNFIFSDNLILARLLILNFVGGTVYGYLFVYKSFWAAAIAHFFVEILIKNHFLH